MVIFSHGNASDLGDVYSFGYKFIKLYDVDFLGYDYTGYGLGKGRYKPSETLIYNDLIIANNMFQMSYIKYKNF